MRAPFRADHVGSLLRRVRARGRRAAGAHRPACRDRRRIPAPQRKDELVKKIEAAARFAPLEQLALGPQCGFASSIRGNPLGEAEQEAKLARIVEVADHIWGSA